MFLNETGFAIGEANGNSYWVRYNATPNNLHIGDCGFRSLAKALDMPYRDIMRLANEMGFAVYKTDRDGNPIYNKHYGSWPMAMLMDRRILSTVDDVIDFSDMDIRLVDFTAKVSRSRRLHGKNLVVELSEKPHGERDTDEHSRSVKKIKSIDKLSALYQKLYRKYGLKNKDSDLEATHVVVVRDGKYYDSWDSGGWYVTLVAVIGNTREIKRISSTSTSLDDMSLTALDKMSDRITFQKSAEKVKTGKSSNKKLQAAYRRFQDESSPDMTIAQSLAYAGVTSSKQLGEVIFLYGNHPCVMDGSSFEFDDDYDGSYAGRYSTGSYGDKCFLVTSDVSIDEICANGKMRAEDEKLANRSFDLNADEIDRLRKSAVPSQFNCCCFDPDDTPFFKRYFKGVTTIGLDYNKFDNGRDVYISELNNKYTYRMTKAYGKQFYVFNLKDFD